jgi:hypothetical protein
MPLWNIGLPHTKQFLCNFILPQTLTTSISKHTAKGCQDNKSVGWKWSSLMQVPFINHCVCSWRPQWSFSILQAWTKHLIFRMLFISILLLFLYGLVYNAVCTSAYSTTVHNLWFSRKYRWQIKVLQNVIKYQPATFQICITLCCCLHKYVLRTYQTLLFLPFFNPHWVLSNPN